MPKAKQRLDLLLVERGLAESRERARALIMAGVVSVNEQRADKPGMAFPVDAPIAVKAALPYVSRGGLKLAAALAAFALGPRVADAVALDAGASTGGFTDVLLQQGARRVYAADVGSGQLAWKLRTDPRVVVMDDVNVRYLESLPEPVALVTADLSFISLSLVLPALLRVSAPHAWLVVLVKPQFEAGRAQVGKGGVVRDPAVHRAVLTRLAAEWQTLGLTLAGLARSPILGPAGNVEFLAYLEKTPPGGEPPAPGPAIDRVLAPAPAAGGPPP
ncbi:MAG TPA: TlyA family RNA methyltransferase [Chloroflexia bacterium]|nr:TlyA family RNA methyltransferase [Chloroflexia bacterium]